MYVPDIPFLCETFSLSLVSFPLKLPRSSELSYRILIFGKFIDISEDSRLRLLIMSTLPKSITIARLVCDVVRNIGLRNVSNFHTLSGLNAGIMRTLKMHDFLKPVSHTIIPANTMQTKWKVEKQCPDCYFVWRQSRKHVFCKKYPSHNQQTRVPRSKEMWIITHKTHGRVRPW